MADSTTINYSFTLIGVGGSRDGWGQKLNANFSAIDTALKAVSDTAGNANTAVAGRLARTGGVMTGPITREGAGAHPYFASAGITNGRIFIAPANGADPTSQPGDLWLAY